MQDLIRFAKEHAVSWEIAPHVELAGGELRPTGFDLTLHAMAPGIDGGSLAAEEIHAGLHDLAERVLPAGLRIALQPYDATLRYRAETGWTPEIDMVVEIRHGEGTFDVVDAADRAHTRAVGEALTRLGVSEGRRRTPAA